MALLSVRCNIDDAVAQVRALDEEQLPFIIAKSLTKVAQAAQGQVRLVEGRVFNIRNDWTQRNTKITPATKSKFVSEVYTDTSNRKTGAPDYLAKQEEGGEKVPVEGRAHLAIPTRYLWQYTPKTRPIPDQFRPAALLGGFTGLKVGDAVAGTFTGGRGSAAHKVVPGRSLRKLGNGGFVAFIQRTKKGTLCIFVRHGGVGYKAAREAEPWYNLVRSAHVNPRLHMEETVKHVVESDFEEIFIEVAKEVGVSVPVR